MLRYVTEGERERKRETDGLCLEDMKVNYERIVKQTQEALLTENLKVKNLV